MTPVAGFPGGTNWFGTPHFLPNNEILVFAGTGSTALDLYKVSANLSTVVNLTNVGNINVKWSMVSDNGQNFYFARDFTNSSTSNALDLICVNASGALVDITGSEFSSGTAPSLELEAFVYRNEPRSAPNASGEVYFIGRPVRAGGLFFDENVYKFNMELGTQAVAVTNYAGLGASTSAVKDLESLNVLSDGSVVYSVGTGTLSIANQQALTFLSSAPASQPFAIGEFAVGTYVVDGTVRVMDTRRAAVWVQSTSSLGSSKAQAYYASLDSSMHGHPLLLTPIPPAVGSTGLVIALAID